MTKPALVLILAFLLFAGVNMAAAQSANVFGLGGGISKATGDGSEYWNMGFNVNGEGFINISPNLLVGGRVAYNRWTPNQDELKKELADFSDIAVDISGAATIIELVPTVRFVAAAGANQNAQVFGQFGAGYYLMNMKADISASFMGETVTETVDDSENKFGINLGAGVILGAAGKTKFSVYPMYNIVFTDEESTKYFTVNVGVVFGN